MCGGAIISDLIAPASRSSRRLTADLLWGSAAADLNKKSRGSFQAKPLRSSPVIDLDDDFEADFLDFKDHSEEEEEIDAKKAFTFGSGALIQERGLHLVSMSFDNGPLFSDVIHNSKWVLLEGFRSGLMFFKSIYLEGG